MEVYIVLLSARREPLQEVRHVREVWVREIVSTEDPALEAVKQIYRESFPPAERVPESSFDAALRKRAEGGESLEGVERFLVAMRDTAVVGFANIYYYVGETPEPPADFGYLIYLAVDARYRSQGIGGLLYRAVLAALSADAAFRGQPLSGLVYEVEDPNLAPDAEERHLRERRIGFYRRLGGEVVEGIRYVQPSLGEGLPDVPMHLMYHPVTAQPPGTELCRLFYRYVYSLEEDDPLVQQAVYPLAPEA